jgi:hypothetical protein
MDFTGTISVPTGSQRYSLVSDLTTMANDVTANDNTLQADIDTRVKTNTAAQLLTLTCSSVGSFGSHVEVRTTGASGRLTCDSNGLNLVYGGSTLTTNGSRFNSNVPIEVPNYPVGVQAANANFVNGAVSALQTANTNLQNSITALDNSKANRYNGDPNWVANSVHANGASYADSAGTAGSATTAGSAGSASSATTAETANRLRNQISGDPNLMCFGYTAEITVPANSTASTAVTMPIDPYSVFVTPSGDGTGACTAVVTAINHGSKTAGFLIRNHTGSGQIIRLHYLALGG